VAPFAVPVRAQRDQLLDDGQDRIADPFGLGFQLCEVEQAPIAVAADLLGRRLRNNAEPRLGAGQRRLDVQIELDPAFV